MKKTLLLILILICSISTYTQNKFSKTKPVIAVSFFENYSRRYNNWLKQGLHLAFSQELQAAPFYNAVKRSKLLWKLRKSGLSRTADKNNADKICKQINSGFLIYGWYSSTANYKKDDTKITLNINVATKTKPVFYNIKLTAPYNELTSLIQKVLTKISDKITGKNTALMFKRSVYTTPSAILNTVKGINNYNGGDYIDAIEYLSKAIKTNGKYIDIAVEYIAKSYVNILENIKKKKKKYKIKVTRYGREKKVEADYKTMKKRFIRRMISYARIATPALYHYASAYYYLEKYGLAINIWTRLLHRMGYGGVLLNWARQLRSKPSAPSVDRFHSYIGTESGYFYTFNKNNGKKQWHYKSSGPITSNPRVYKEYVYFMSGGYPANLSELACIDRMSGTLRFSHMLSGEPTGTPVICKNTLIAGTATGSGNFTAVDADTGQILWRRKSVFPISFTADKKYFYVIFRRYIPDGDNVKTYEIISKIDPVSGTVQWNVKIEYDQYPLDHRQNNVRIAVNKKHVFIVSQNYFMVLKKSSGSSVLKRSFSERLTYVYQKHGIAYIGMHDKIHAFDIDKEKILFTYKANGIITYPVVTDKSLYFGTSDKYVYALDYKTGKFIAQFIAHGEIYYPPVADEGDVYISSFDGFLYKLTGGRKIFRFGVSYKEILYSIAMAYLKKGSVKQASRFLSLM